MCSVLLVGELTAEDFAVNWQTTSARKYAVASVGKEMEQSFFTGRFSNAVKWYTLLVLFC